MTKDLVVVLPGIMGSTLGVRKPGADGSPRPVWAPTAGAIWRGVTGLGPTITDYPVPEGIGDAHPGDGIEPMDLMPDAFAIPGLWTPIKGYSRLVNFLESVGYRSTSASHPIANLLPVPYDWRLSNRYNGQRLIGIVEPALDRWRSQGGPYADAQLVFICHSMGGLVARWYIEQCGGAGLTRKLITLGTPWRGAAKTIPQLVNGVDARIGSLSVRLTQFARSLPSSYQLLPEYACIRTGTRYVKTTETNLPGLDTARVADAMTFYTTLQESERARPGSRDITHMVVGTRQPTWATASIHEAIATPEETFGADNDFGDGTVPLTGGIGHDEPLDTNLISRIAEQHGNIQRNPVAFDEIHGILTASPIRRKLARTVALRVYTPDLALTSDGVKVRVDIDDTTSHGLLITIHDENGQLVHSRTPKTNKGCAEVDFADLAPGIHTLTTQGLNPGSPLSPVTSTVLVWAGTPALASHSSPRLSED